MTKKEYKSDKFNALSSVQPKKSDKKTPKNITVKSVEEFKKNKQSEIIFSFKYFDRKHKYFNLGGVNKICDNWFLELIDILKEISNRTWTQIATNPVFDAHPQNFSQTNFQYKLFDEKTIKQLECVQFRISKSKGRVHGFIVDNCFYIYWLDPNHNMIDSDNYEGAKRYKPFKSCYEILIKENTDLRKTNKYLIKRNEVLESKDTSDVNEILDEFISIEEENKWLKKQLHEYKKNHKNVNDKNVN
ncbi:hypothetical protein [Senegalia massiliensis]|uniref:hypothetical protein n=1 Tax=Senegalia massiliensis TaxID=1720316 RepID=UPI0010302CC9|nr:hypothetical protein [Senegalia massiliensis]